MTSLAVGTSTAVAQDHTRVAFVQAMKQLTASAGSGEPFVVLRGVKTSDDHSGDTTYKLKLFIPIFAECSVHNDSHVSPYVICDTNENKDMATVKRRYNEMVSDLKPLLKNHDPRTSDPWQGALGCQRPGCLHAFTVQGSELLVELRTTSIHMELGNF